MLSVSIFESISILEIQYICTNAMFVISEFFVLMILINRYHSSNRIGHKDLNPNHLLKRAPIIKLIQICWCVSRCFFDSVMRACCVFSFFPFFSCTFVSLHLNEMTCSCPAWLRTKESIWRTVLIVLIKIIYLYFNDKWKACWRIVCCCYAVMALITLTVMV